MDPGIVIALIATVVSPTIVGLLAAMVARKSKLEDWDREDKVAAKAAEAAKLLLDAQHETITRTNEVARLQAVDSADTKAQLKAIHTLVNSDMTAARQSELVSVRALVAALRHVVDLDHQAGRPPGPDDLDAIEAGEARATELAAILADRLAQQRLVEKQTEA